MASLARFVVYIPNANAPAVRSKALRHHKSISAYLQSLIEDDRDAKPDRLRTEIERLNKRVDEVLEFSRYLMVVQNATADRVSPGLVKEVQAIYHAKFGDAPNAG